MAEGVGAGRLVDQCGLKGHRIGDAQISHMHANIMVNLGQATAADVRALIAPGMHGEEVLLGMSALKQLEFTQRDGTLLLRQTTTQ